jgi:hypothetical protein
MHEVEIDLNRMSMGTLKIDGKSVECSRLKIVCIPGQPAHVTADILVGRLVGKISGAIAVCRNTPTNESGPVRSYSQPGN